MAALAISKRTAATANRVTILAFMESTSNCTRLFHWRACFVNAHWGWELTRSGPRRIVSPQIQDRRVLEGRKREILVFVTGCRRAFARQCICSTRPDGDHPSGAGAHGAGN